MDIEFGSFMIGVSVTLLAVQAIRFACSACTDKNLVAGGLAVLLAAVITTILSNSSEILQLYDRQANAQPVVWPVVAQGK
ncbi:MAG: hypothetical protein KC877_00535 [Candidatus Kaiserbacteria bacterium]|nr:hypothetical protein [Candidatus Kaiserbacteria bacterium]MCB9816038.1 hypothetical protein [Candidatus Nomurabacteria bacterium]